MTPTRIIDRPREITLVPEKKMPRNCDALTDEFVTVDGKQLREEDGVTFDY